MDKTDLLISFFFPVNESIFEHLKILFGNDYKLENIRNLNQPGQFVTNSFVILKTDWNFITIILDTSHERYEISHISDLFSTILNLFYRFNNNKRNTPTFTSKSIYNN